MLSHEIKANPAPIPRTKIVEAYGLQKCPKLVEQIAGDDLEVRNNALAVLGEEFQNPFAIIGCAQNGLIKILAAMVVDPDFNTRLLSSKALAIAALDANGLAAIVDDDCVGDLLNGMNDPSEVVRGNIYECIRYVTQTSRGIDVCVANGVASAFVNALTREGDQLKPTILASISNIVSAKEEGLSDALNANVVTICIDLLSCENPEARTEAAKVLGFICYDEDAKTEALENNVVESLMSLLIEDLSEESRVRQPTHVLAAATMALMAVTSSDEGKRRIFSCCENGSAVGHIAALLYVDNRPIRLNTMKVISNIAVFPPLRTLLLEESSVILNLKRLRDSGDALLEKHANIALAAVNWTP